MVQATNQVSSGLPRVWMHAVETLEQTRHNTMLMEQTHITHIWR